jgi:hypothetical protein
MTITVYLVEHIEDEEYGNYSPVRVFRSLAQAQEYIASLGSPVWHPWYAKHPLPCYVITPIEME